MSSSIFAGVEQGPAIEVFALNRAFQEDSNPKKANLGVGGKFLLSTTYFIVCHAACAIYYLLLVNQFFYILYVCVCI